MADLHHCFIGRTAFRYEDYVPYSQITLTATGYDTGYISSVLVTIGSSLGHELTSSDQELVTSLTSGGALVGAVIAGLLADKYGRKLPIWLACIVFVIGTTLQTAAFHLPQFAVGRFIVGLGVGSAAMIVPLYISELAPARYRGQFAPTWTESRFLT